MAPTVTDDVPTTAASVSEVTVPIINKVGNDMEAEASMFRPDVTICIILFLLIVAFLVYYFTTMNKQKSQAVPTEEPEDLEKQVEADVNEQPDN